MSALERSFCVVSLDTLNVTRIVSEHDTPAQAEQELDLYWDTVAAQGEVVAMMPSDHPNLTGPITKLAVC